MSVSASKNLASPPCSAVEKVGLGVPRWPLVPIRRDSHLPLDDNNLITKALRRVPEGSDAQPVKPLGADRIGLGLSTA